MSEINKPRPKFLALNEIRLPLAGIISILHRVSGAGLFLLLPLLIYLLQLSLGGTPESAAQFAALTDNILVRLILLGLSWAFIHHFCMGIRILLLDLHIGIEKADAQRSAKVVTGVSIVLTLLAAVKLLGGH